MKDKIPDIPCGCGRLIKPQKVPLVRCVCGRIYRLCRDKEVL